MFDKYKAEMKSYVDSMTPEEMKLEERKKQQKMARKLKMVRIVHTLFTFLLCNFSQGCQKTGFSGFFSSSLKCI